MDVKNHNTNRKKRVVRKRWNAAVLIALFVGILLTVFQYLGFVSKTVYEESVSHLTEIFHQSDNMLSELTNKNLTYLHIWGEYLQNTSDESEIREYIEKAQEDAGFVEFYFLSADGNYKDVTGKTGYLGLQENIEEEIRQGNDVIANAAVPGKSQLLVFATPRAHGIYQGFEYDAIAIAYENTAIVDVLDFLPQETAGRDSIIQILQGLTKTLVKYQDPQSGTWYQVTDQGAREGNYLESSATALFIYTLAKAINKGYIGNEYIEPTQKAFDGMVKTFTRLEEDGSYTITNCCAVAGLGGDSKRYRDGSFEYYISEPIIENDPKSVGSFILAAIEYEKMTKK